MCNYMKIKKEIIFYARRMYNEHLVTATSGNISIRLPDDDNAFIITPSSEEYLLLTEDRLVCMTVNGQILSCPENGKPSSEWRLHAEIYKSNKLIKSIVHTHSPYATSFAVIHESIPLILVEMIPWLGGSIRVSKYAPAGTTELGLNVANEIKNSGGILMENHGVVAVADSMKLAYTRASYIEDAAKIYYMAKCIGKPYVIE